MTRLRKSTGSGQQTRPNTATIRTNKNIRTQSCRACLLELHILFHHSTTRASNSCSRPSLSADFFSWSFCIFIYFRFNSMWTRWHICYKYISVYMPVHFFLCLERRSHFFFLPMQPVWVFFSELLKLLAMTLCLLLHDNLKPGVCYRPDFFVVVVSLFCEPNEAKCLQNGLKRPLFGVYTLLSLCIPSLLITWVYDYIIQYIGVCYNVLKCLFLSD